MTRHNTRRQHNFRLDIAGFACVVTRLATEFDGLHHPLAAAADARRTAFLNAEGWTVLGFWNARVITRIDDVICKILAHLPEQ